MGEEVSGIQLYEGAGTKAAERAVDRLKERVREITPDQRCEHDANDRGTDPLFAGLAEFSLLNFANGAYRATWRIVPRSMSHRQCLLRLARDSPAIGSFVTQLAEPPDADPPVRWYGRGGVVKLPPIPIGCEESVLRASPASSPRACRRSLSRS